MQLKPSTRLIGYFSNYGSRCKSYGNRLCHYVALPILTVALLGLSSRVELGPTNAGIFLLVVANLWYLYLDWKIAIPFSSFILGSYLIGLSIAPGFLWSGFCLGGVLQLVGHYYFEKGRPAFFINLPQLLVGPLWVFSRVIGYEKI